MAVPSLRFGGPTPISMSSARLGEARQESASLGRLRVLLALRLVEQDLQHQQSRAHHDGAIREIENWPLIPLHIEQQKVDHAPAHYPVPEIPQSSTHNQR